MRELSDEKSPLVSPAVRDELRALLGHTVSYVLGRQPRLLRYLDGE
jgi:hypothetical protein